MWVMQYRKNPSTPSWFDNTRWSGWNGIRKGKLEDVIARWHELMNNPSCHESWKSDLIEYQIVEEETGEIIPWSTIAIVVG